MTINQLKEQLQALSDKGFGELDFRLTVDDYYSRYGEEATLLDRWFINEGFGCVTFVSHLNDKDDKHPKITYRA